MDSQTETFEYFNSLIVFRCLAVVNIIGNEMIQLGYYCFITVLIDMVGDCDT